MRKSFAQALVLITAGVCFGCGQPATPPAAAPAEQPLAVETTTPAIKPPASDAAAPADAAPVAAAPSGFQTPEEAFAAIQDALGKKDWRTAAGCMTEESREMMTSGLLMAGGLMAAFGGDQTADLTAVMKKHGVDLPDPASNPFAATPPGETPETEPEEPAADMPDIKDKAGFIGDMLAALEKMDQGKSSQKHEQWAAGTLEDLSIDGDAATARIVIQADEDAKSEDVAFRRAEGGWLVHLPENAFGMNAGGPGDGFSTTTDADTQPAAPLTETVLEGGLTLTLALTFEKPFSQQFFSQEFPDRTLFATLNLVGEPILNTYEYGEFQIESITDDTGASLELAAPLKDQFDAEFSEEFVELNDFFLDKKDTLPILMALTPPAEDAKSITLAASCKLKVREALVIADVLQSVGGEIKDDRLAGRGTFTVDKQSADNGEPDNGLLLVVAAPEGTVEGITLLDGQGQPLDSASTFSYGFGSEMTYGVSTSEKLPADTQLRITLGGTESIQIVPLKIEAAELP